MKIVQLCKLYNLNYKKTPKVKCQKSSEKEFCFTLGIMETKQNKAINQQQQQQNNGLRDISKIFINKLVSSKLNKSIKAASGVFMIFWHISDMKY